MAKKQTLAKRLRSSLLLTQLTHLDENKLDVVAGFVG